MYTMKDILYLTLIASLLFFAASSQASPRQLGLGFMIGGPTGISANYKMSKENSLDAGLGFHLGDGDFHFHSTYLWHFLNTIKLERYSFGWYLGGGGRILSKDRRNAENEILIGPRGSAGLNFPIKKQMFDAFVELALIMNLIEETDLDADFAIGARYYF